MMNYEMRIIHIILRAASFLQLAAFARPIHILLHTTGTTLTCGPEYCLSSDNMYLRDKLYAEPM